VIKIKHILVVDDNKVNLVFTKQILHDYYNLTLVISGKQALEFLSKKIPDIILLDLLMPEMDGIETLKKIKENENLKNIPVIFLSATYDTAVQQECLRLGANDFVTKPFTAKEMIEHIENILNRNI